MINRDLKYFILFLLFITNEYCFSQDSTIMQYEFYHEEMAILSPGDELLKNGVLITNQSFKTRVFFELSINGLTWEKKTLNPRRSGIYTPSSIQEFYFYISSRFGKDRIIEKHYKMRKGSCYSIFWDKKSSFWDLKENSCDKILRN